MLRFWGKGVYTNLLMATDKRTDGGTFSLLEATLQAYRGGTDQYIACNNVLQHSTNQQLSNSSYAVGTYTFNSTTQTFFSHFVFEVFHSWKLKSFFYSQNNDSRICLLLQSDDKDHHIALKHRLVYIDRAATRKIVKQPTQLYLIAKATHRLLCLFRQPYTSISLGLNMQHTITLHQN